MVLALRRCKEMKTNLSGEAELNGLIDLGAKKEALALAAEFLHKERISDDEFDAALRTILTFDFKIKGETYAFNAPKWAPIVELVYASMSQRQQQRLRPRMLWFFSQCDDADAAVRFLDSEYSTPSELAIALRVAVGTQQGEGFTQGLAVQAEQFLTSDIPEFEGDDLHDALAKYYFHAGQLDGALRHSRAIRNLDVFSGRALLWPVELQSLGVLAAAKERLAVIDEYRRRAPTQMDLALPEFRDLQLDRAARCLLGYEQKLKRLLPQKFSFYFNADE